MDALRHIARVMVAHAPHMHRPPEEREAYWDKLTHHMLDYDTSFLLIDANGRTGSVQSAGIGPEGWAEEENDNGYQLRTLLGTTNMRAVNTLLPHREGYTWSANKEGPYHRIDYIVTSKQVYEAAYDVCTQRDYDKIHDKEYEA